MKTGVPTRAAAGHHGTGARVIELNHDAKFVPGDLARYAALAAPGLRVAPEAAYARGDLFAKRRAG